MNVADTTELTGPTWLEARRARASADADTAAMPTSRDEIWRYSRIEQLDLDRFRAVGPADRSDDQAPGPSLSDRVHALVDEIGPRAALIVTLDGVLTTVSSSEPDERLTVGRVADHTEGEALLGSVITAPSEFVLLNDAHTVDPLVVDVPAGVVIDEPVVVVHHLSGGDGTAVFPRLTVRVGEGASASVVELVVDSESSLLAAGGHSVLTGLVAPGEQLVVPVAELQVADTAHLRFVGIQAVGSATWQIAEQRSTIGERATLESFSVALGGSYARLRADSALVGIGGTSRLRAAFVGRDDQMLDFRTLQNHLAPKTVSDLLFMGAVADRAHSVYSGVIHVARGAVKTDARQTNHNLVLDEGAHADSVPNLDILENDVACSHGSTVGPVDEEQRYYLESRGIPPEEAEQLIVAGFFASIAEQVPVAGARTLIDRALAARIGAVHV